MNKDNGGKQYKGKIAKNGGINNCDKRPQQKTKQRKTHLAAPARPSRLWITLSDVATVAHRSARGVRGGQWPPFGKPPQEVVQCCAGQNSTTITSAKGDGAVGIWGCEEDPGRRDQRIQHFQTQVLLLGIMLKQHLQGPGRWSKAGAATCLTPRGTCASGAHGASRAIQSCGVCTRCQQSGFL